MTWNIQPSDLNEDDQGLIRAALRVAVSHGSGHLRESYYWLLNRIDGLPVGERPEVKRQGRPNGTGIDRQHYAPWLKKALKAGFSEAELNQRAVACGVTLKQACEAVI